ncbi:MAG: PhoU domain-containing protein [Firmicutes bacterium]|nr:PhoU domain-containing protein [Bacillota bacterium]
MLLTFALAAAVILGTLYMAEMATNMVVNSISAFLNRDLKKARKVWMVTTLWSSHLFM